MNPITISLTGIGILLLLMLLNMPIGFAMILVGILGLSFITTPQAALTVVSSNIWGNFASYTLLVIPLFVLMGEIAFVSGVSKKLFYTAYRFLGHFPGGLAISTIAGCAMFAAICGSSPATAATMGAVSFPEMKKYKYDPRLATGAIASGGTLGILIPPSVVLIIYGVQSQQSIGKLFIAGILPGIVLATLFCITVFIWCRINPQLGPPGPSSTVKEKIASLPGAIEMVVLFALVIGGLLLGWFTATEAASAGVAGAIVISLIMRELSWSRFKTALKETMSTACMVITIVAGAMIFSRFMVMSGITALLADWVMNLDVLPIVVLIIIMLVYIIGGCFIDSLSFMIITMPFFYPVITALGFDPIWYGIVLVVLLETGAVTPPVGINVYVIYGIAKDVPMSTIFRGIVPFFGAMLVCLALLTLFPIIATFLPQFMMY